MSLLTLKDVHKSFGPVQVLEGIDFELNRDEIVALLGENGAGKSTLMKIIAGVHSPSSGKLLLEGKEVAIQSPKHSQQLGISIIHQEFNLLRDMSIAENIFLGRMKKNRFGTVDWKRMFSETEVLLKRVGIGHLSPKQLVMECSIAEQQLIEIAKALSFDANILIMDEPSATLNNEETDNLMQLMKELNEQHIGIIFITHRLEEVFRVADKAVVLRDGHLIGERRVTDTDKDEIISMMVGRELKDIYPERNIQSGDNLLDVSSLSVKGKLHDVNLTLRKGEILGVAGLMGSGQTALSKAMFGLLSIESGEVRINGTSVRSPQQAISEGIALLTDDRKSEGLVLELSVAENILMPNYRTISNRGYLPKKKMKTIVNQWIKELSIKTSTPEVEVRTLSGGNQQKVVLGKWLETKPQVLILNEPTRGVDVGAKSEIYKLIKNLADEGMGIILISSEMPEILGLSHRVLVMNEGRITGELDIHEATQEKIFAYAVGGENG
ncbi:sugar ABC transporter ATP-binding protein [Salipaludibacillus daqingensis]|uniref:sugar ABC transporter ATP-binding protein n=1 Tax=Salipaludibacillus daqingensis TaxID=3041001 RepID=UPI002476FAAB|nr:sugar ABC transporter ATP-binding protein [Salipaludibacillus daqingensis]